MKVVNENIYNFFRYEKKYNDSIKEVYLVIKILLNFFRF